MFNVIFVFHLTQPLTYAKASCQRLPHPQYVILKIIYER